ncbi:MAG: helix-turn-helix transcriptional regulator, partial [Muribaculaceae bacterium]|nr:helix-turn-helix transcriptional regulator [Muribaculaceae bacterium]
MAIVQASSRLAVLVADSPEILPVLNRFGIFLGTADRTVAQVCEALNIDRDFLLAILNTFLNEEYFPERTLRSFHASALVKYLTDAHRHCREFSLPNVERHFMSLVKVSGSDNNLALMLDFFMEVKGDLLRQHAADSDSWMPALLALEAGGRDVALAGIPVAGSAAVEERLSDLKMMYVRHLSGNVEPNLCYAVLTGLVALERDVMQNGRIRDRILVP